MPKIVPPAAALLTVALLLPLVPLQARAAASKVRLDDVSRGSLLFPGGERGVFREVPAEGTEVKLTVTGLVVRAQVTQRFVNRSEQSAEALYAFPLPDGAAVDGLEVTIGQRRIVGVIKEREEARRVYEEAKREGKKASLVEQHRPNLFTNAVAGIPPGATVEVTLSYQEVLRYDDGLVRLTFPLAITPRYGAAGPAAKPTLGGPLSAELEVDAGFPLASYASPSHGIRKRTPKGESTFALQLERKTSERDLVLEWRATPSAEPRARLLYESFGGEQYALLVVTPPTGGAAAAPVPRELTLVIDTSGSMHGESMEQAKRALSMALAKLRPSDHFNVIEFNSAARALFAAPVRADSERLAEARRFIGGLTANGGTEMMQALELAFSQEASELAGVRQVLFITDGAVSNEAALFDHIRDDLGQRRLFTVGIGRAPNAHFMRKAAEFGRGTFTSITDVSEVEEKMQALFRKISRPALTDLQVDFGVPVEAYPPRVPDLYAGEAIVVAARATELGREVSLRGRAGSGPFDAKVTLAAGEARGAVHKLWAGRKVEALEDGGGRYGSDEQRLSIVQTALAHGIVTRFTSLVAVEETQSLAKAPHEPQALMAGRLPQGGTPALLLLLLGGGLLGLGGAGAWRGRRA